MSFEELKKTIDGLRHDIDGLKKDVKKLNDKDESDNVLEEWKTARSVIDKFDGILIDLRKYSFSIITGLITAQGILGFSADKIIPQIEIIAVICTMPVIPALYWLDRYFFGLLWGAIMRASCLEKFRLETIQLTLSISGFAKSQPITKSEFIPLVYFMFLASTGLLGAFVIHYSDELSKYDIYSSVFIILFIISGSVLTIIHFGTNIEKNYVTKIVENLIKIYGKENRKSTGKDTISSNDLDNFIDKVLNSDGKNRKELKKTIDPLKDNTDRIKWDEAIRAVLDRKNLPT